MAFEIHDNRVIEQKLKKNDENVTDQERYRLFAKPSVLEVFHYSFCYAGVLTGGYDEEVAYILPINLAHKV